MSQNLAKLQALTEGQHCPSVRTRNLAQFCDLGYYLSSLTELSPLTVARGEKAKFLIVIYAESIGKLL